MDKPKSLANISGKPFLEYQIAFLRKYKITDIVVCIGYKGQQIEDYFLDGRSYGVSIKYSKEKDLLGTGGAIKNARGLLKRKFLVLNGDTLFLTNLHSFINFHNEQSSKATVALTTSQDQSRYGTVVLNDNKRIIDFREKSPSSSNLINAGIYLFDSTCFPWNSLPDVFSLEKDFLPRLILQANVYGFVDDSYFIDIGTVDGYRKLENDIQAGSIKVF
jgi:NDP-sugar pyrophosphorylase family protein